MQYSEQDLPMENTVQLNDLPLQGDYVKKEDAYHTLESNQIKCEATGSNDFQIIFQRSLENNNQSTLPELDTDMHEQYCMYIHAIMNQSNTLSTKAISPKGVSNEVSLILSINFCVSQIPFTSTCH